MPLSFRYLCILSDCYQVQGRVVSLCGHHSGPFSQINKLVLIQIATSGWRPVHLSGEGWRETPPCAVLDPRQRRVIVPWPKIFLPNIS